MSALRPRDLFATGFRRRIRSSLRSRPVLLVGPVGSGAEDLARGELERAKNPVLLQPTVGTTPAEVIASVVAQIVHRIEPVGIGEFDGDSPHARRARLNLARRYGPDAARALDVAHGTPPEGWALVDAVGIRAGEESVPPVLMSITNAHRLPEPLLWELRDLANANVRLCLRLPAASTLQRCPGRGRRFTETSRSSRSRDWSSVSGSRDCPSRSTRLTSNGCSCTPVPG
jgi:hypothetical protein